MSRFTTEVMKPSCTWLNPGVRCRPPGEEGGGGGQSQCMLPQTERAAGVQACWTIAVICSESARPHSRTHRGQHRVISGWNPCMRYHLHHTLTQRSQQLKHNCAEGTCPHDGTHPGQKCRVSR